MTPDGSRRRYICDDCGEPVTANWFERGGFEIGCACSSLDAAPYEMGQADTPRSWHVERPECCRDVPTSEMDAFYGGPIADYQCPECGATYAWDGEMIDAPESDTPGEVPLPDGQTTLSGEGITER